MSEKYLREKSGIYAAAVAARTRAARAILGLSQQRLAQEAGISLPALNLLERQESSPRLETVESIEAVFRQYGIAFASDPGGRHTRTLSAELIESLARKRAAGEAVTARGKMPRGGRPTPV